MKHFFAFRMLTLTLCMVLGTLSLSAQVFWTETFTGQASATSRWISGGTNTGPEKWTWSNDPKAGYQEPTVPAFGAPTASTGYFLFNSDANGVLNDDHNVTLTIKDPIDCSGKTNVKLRFYLQFGKVIPDSKVFVGVSKDGTTFKDYQILQNTVDAYIYDESAEVDLNEADNQAKVWLRFRWEGNGEYHWKVDDLALSSNPPAVSCQDNPLKILCESFETYLEGTLVSQAASRTWWIPWNYQTNNGILSADVSSVEDTLTNRIIASDGKQSMRVRYEANSAGTVQGDDQLLKLGNRSAGRFSVRWNMFIPKGKNAYYNFQHLENPNIANPPNDNWTMDMYFLNDGRDSLGNPLPYVVGTHPVGKWFTVEHIFDLDRNLAYFYLNGELRRAWNFVKNLGSVDFYATDKDSEYYVDEVEFVRLPALTEDADVCGSAIDITYLTGGAVGAKKVSPLFNNTTATSAATDPVIDCWDENKVNRSTWYTFIGDGNTYNIQTVQCTATAAAYIGAAQQNPGNTQMAVYGANDCSNLGTGNIVACNDDLFATGSPDLRAGVEFATEKAKRYYVLVDGAEKSGVTATGSYCLQMEQTTIKRCEDIKLDEAATELNLGYVCARDTIDNYIRTDLTKYNIVPIGDYYGLAWALTGDSVPAGVWPPNLGNAYFGNFAIRANAYVPALINDSLNIPWNRIYYLTPVVFARGTKLIDPAQPAFLDNIDTVGICYKVGKSLELGLLPPLRPLTATVATTNAVQPANNNGTATVTASGGSGTFFNLPNLYRFRWSNNATSNRITNLTPGTYTVTIADPLGCTLPITRTVTITSIVGIQDPASVSALTMTPNPTADEVLVRLTLNEAAPVRFEVANALGQVLQTIEAGTAITMDQKIALKQYQSGTYFIRVTVNGDTAIRRVVLQK